MIIWRFKKASCGRTSNVKAALGNVQPWEKMLGDLWSWFLKGLDFGTTGVLEVLIFKAWPGPWGWPALVPEPGIKHERCLVRRTPQKKCSMILWWVAIIWDEGGSGLQVFSGRVVGSGGRVTFGKGWMGWQWNLFSNSSLIWTSRSSWKKGVCVCWVYKMGKVQGGRSVKQIFIN